ncbi:MAG TPA: AAA family ATPase, partial [Leptolyngbyaceae cyanobacterium]
MQAQAKNVFWRVAVVGAPGSGKTTLARQIAQKLQIPHVELDALFW